MLYVYDIVCMYVMYDNVCMYVMYDNVCMYVCMSLPELKTIHFSLPPLKAARLAAALLIRRLR